jgi:hypothetical protein
LPTKSGCFHHSRAERSPTTYANFPNPSGTATRSQASLLHDDRTRDPLCVVDRRTLNRTLLARQLLLERTDADPLDLVDRLVGMQAQVPLDPYVGLWSRLRSFEPERLGEALLARRAVRMTFLRSTLHLVTSGDALRLRPLLQPMLERAYAASPFAGALADLELQPVLARGSELLQQEPRTMAQLREVLGAEWPAYDANALAYAVRYLVPLVQITPRGVWGKTLKPTVTTLAAWLEESAGDSATADELVLRYLRSFGPATAADIRTWSWLTDVKPVLERLRPHMRTYEDERGRTLFDVEDGVIGDPAVPAPVRLLPEYDNVFLSHADRGRIINDVPWNSSFRNRGVVLVDGFLAGAWKLTREKTHATLEINPHTRPSRQQRADIRQEAEALLAFLSSEAATRRLVLR